MTYPTPRGVYSRPQPRRRSILPWVLVAVAVIVVVIGAAGIAVGMRGGKAPAVTNAPTSSTPSAKPKPTPADPYAVYLKLAPKGSVHLSREDAQARALLGCGQDWAPGTVDAALAKAYASLCKQR